MGSLAKGDTRAALRKYNAEKAVGKKPKPPSKSKVPKVSEEEKQAAKSKKLAAKEVDKEQKRIAREEKAAAKEREKEFAKANTLTDKKNSTAQMIVDLPSCLDVRLGSHAKALLLPVGAELGEWESEISLIKWRRKVEAIYDEQAGHFVPCPKHIKDEMHIMYVMQANEFVSLATGPEGKDLDSHFLRLRAKYDGYTIIYLIEGLTPWMRKNKGVKNAQFQEAVRNMGQDEENSATQRRKPKKQAEYIDEDLIEDALLRLQVVHKPLIHHTNSAIETGQWVVAFTQHISTIPHRKLKDALDTTFSMESGQVKTGEDAADTYLRMLSELKMVTAPVACGIAAEYPSVQKLIAGFEADGPLILEDCRKTANKDGALTDKRIGPAISKRVHRVFTGMDPWEMV
ncbi:ERCC4 domain-containing protein [Phlyctema vagabunda]|uniref:ERCC4 domain-containing protein n=1 Tax=Phlyctema vagabunda TaxID=108571 RepID=A0ABR4PDR5_9HELO